MRSHRTAFATWLTACFSACLLLLTLAAAPVPARASTGWFACNTANYTRVGATLVDDFEGGHNYHGTWKAGDRTAGFYLGTVHEGRALGAYDIIDILGPGNAISFWHRKFNVYGKFSVYIAPGSTMDWQLIGEINEFKDGDREQAKTEFCYNGPQPYGFLVKIQQSSRSNTNIDAVEKIELVY